MKIINTQNTHGDMVTWRVVFLYVALSWTQGLLPGQAADAPPAKVRSSEKLPTVLLMIDEKSMGTMATAEIETLATEMLIKEKVSVVDQDLVNAKINKQQQLLKIAGDARGAAALGLQFGADVVIVGEVVSKPAARRIEGTNLRTYQGIATLRAIRSDNAMAIAAGSAHASVMGVEDVAGNSEALTAAGRKTLGKLIPEMLDAYEKAHIDAGGGAPLRVTLTVGGMDQLWKLKALREMLHNLDKVQKVAQRSYVSGLATFSLESRLPTEELSEMLVLKPPQGFKLQVLSISPGELDLRAVATP
ncbi:MAG: hypothetical protein NTV49_03540 [Kiritimatiellaeota bacterium]|nr:hypothetical protein [Kiritimatiellota bacterium]